MRAAITLIFSILTFVTFAQKGIIRGEVFEESTGELLPFVAIQVEGTDVSAVTDLDGKFELQLDPGTYTIVFKVVGFADTKVSGVEVAADDVVVLDPVSMSEGDVALKEVQVTAEFKRNSENALLTVKARSPNMIDGVSASTFRKTGDSDAASAVKRVPGISISGGKYVYVRGIGDRYNKTVLNGVDIPGLDPDKNTLQMDIFPTSIIENMIINKTFVANLPADFTGGIINLELKSFPEERIANVSLSLGYNPSMHFNSEYLTYEGGSTDFLGFDDGTRTIPGTTNLPLFADVVAAPVDDPDRLRYNDILRSFSPTLSAMEQSSLMDFGLSASFGDQVAKGDKKIGYSFLVNYSNSTEYYDDVTYGLYAMNPGDASALELEERVLQTGRLGINNVMLSGMAGFAVKGVRNKYTFNVLHIQNGESNAGIFDYISRNLGSDYESYQHTLTYTQRALSNVFLSGKHNLQAEGWEIEWKLSPTYSTINDPDFRNTRYRTDGGALSIGTESGFPERIWRDLAEINVASQVNIQKEYTVKERKATFSFGGGHTFKYRDYVIRNFALNIRGDLPLTGDPNELMSEEFLWPYDGNLNEGTTYEPQFIPVNPNQYESNINNSALYVSNDMMLGSKLRTIIGVRAEYYVHRYTGQDQLGTNIFNNEKVLENLGIFPSLSLVYAVTEKQNLRFAYGRTVARPSFKEMSFAEIYDPVTGRIFVGGLFSEEGVIDGQDVTFWDGNLQSTDIHNLDLRWEVFPSPGRTISVSAFYKYFINPIEIIQYATQQGSFQPRNVGNGQVLGGEFEIRENLSFISESLSTFSAVLNVTVVDSRIDFTDVEFNSRVINARDGQEIKSYRRMAGQAPYIINAGFTFNGTEEGFGSGLEAGLFYNVQGPTLEVVGIADRPDVFTVPFHSLNFNITKRFGKDDNFAFGLKASNLLNDRKESVFRAFNADDPFFTSMAPGTRISAKFSMNF